MKENLILKKYKKKTVNGTFNLLEDESFFSSKIMDIEDNIIIDDKSIQYFQYFINVDSTDSTGKTLAKNNGYQYNAVDKFKESFFLLDVVELKLTNHTISEAQQKDIDRKNNTKWKISINIKNILREYLFAKIKERRTFKSLNYKNFLNNDINNSIYEYINLNILDRYKFDNIIFYSKYTDIKNNTVFSNTILKQFDPKFKSDIELIENKNNDVNINISNFIDPLANVNIDYFQTKPSSDYKFDYYFNIYFKKI